MDNNAAVRPIRAIIFDLDGTLYPGTATLDYYVHDVLGRSGYDDAITSVLAETTMILEGRHPTVQMGDFVRRSVPGGTLEHFRPAKGEQDRPADARDWDYLGDGWTVAYVLTRIHEISHDDYVAAFHASRYAMAEGRLQHVPSLSLERALRTLRERGCYLVMQSNSSEDSGLPTLSYLGLADVFDEYIYSAGKPEGMKTLVDRLKKERGISPDQILSVGDHPWNDIVAARELGTRTLLISPYQGLETGAFAPRVHTGEELADYLLEVAGIVSRETEGIR